MANQTDPNFLTTQQKQGNVNAQLEVEKANCINQGGVWDGKKCTFPNGLPNSSFQNIQGLPKKQDAAAPPQNVKLNTPEIIRDERGIATGISLPNGDTFLGIGKKETDFLANKFSSDRAAPEGTLEAGTQQAAAQRQQQIARLTQLAQQGLITPQELQAIQGSNIDVGQALGAGAVGVLPGLVAGATAGAIGGAAVGGLGAIPGAIGGAAIGGIGSFLNGVRSNIKSQTAGQFSADQTALLKGQTMLRALITDTNRNPQNAPENIALFYQTLNNIDAAHAKTYKDAHENLNKFLGNDGTEQLAKFEVFDSQMRAYYINAFNTALQAPNPSQIVLTEEDLSVDLAP